MKRRIVVKTGGSTLDAENMLADFAEAVAKVSEENDVAIVHGGGKDIGRQLAKLGRDFQFVNGQRVTDSETMDVVEMVLSGIVNKWIVRYMERAGVKAAGISGTDRGLFYAEKMVVPEGDLGFVGCITKVNTELIEVMIANGIVPVISPVSVGPDFRAYNVNADHAACSLAEAWKADDLIYITDVPGIKVGDGIKPRIQILEIDDLIKNGEITGGMIPKVRSSASAVCSGVGRVHIIGWKGPFSIADSMDTQKQWGTVIE